MRIPSLLVLALSLAACGGVQVVGYTPLQPPAVRVVAPPSPPAAAVALSLSPCEAATKDFEAANAQAAVAARAYYAAFGARQAIAGKAMAPDEADRAVAKLDAAMAAAQVERARTSDEALRLSVVAEKVCPRPPRDPRVASRHRVPRSGRRHR